MSERDDLTEQAFHAPIIVSSRPREASDDRAE